MKKAILIPGSFYTTMPQKPGMKIRSDDLVELHRLDKMLNDGWEIVSITPNPGSATGLGGDASFLVILEKTKDGAKCRK